MPDRDESTMDNEPTPITRAVASAYHHAWTTKRFDDAIALLSSDLVVEVPVNHYPDRASFSEALIGFGSIVERVDLLAELAGGEEAMVLYDMTVSGLGTIRVAEHFTVLNGQIVRLRQIHDTVAIRAAGLADR